jgi:hypothetical protein
MTAATRAPSGTDAPRPGRAGDPVGTATAADAGRAMEVAGPIDPPDSAAEDAADTTEVTT